MKMLVPRRPVMWGLLFVADGFLGLVIGGLVSGEIYLAPGRHSPGRFVTLAENRSSFWEIMGFEAFIAVLAGTLAFVRFVPLEDYFLNSRQRLSRPLDQGHRSLSIWLWWALVGEMALVLWVVRR